MAITKIHPIKTTLDLSIKYICNPEKTDEETLISTHACGHETAALEFEMTRQSWNSSTKNLARHLIQSFDPDDKLTPEIAHEIGKKLIDEALKGKYEYILTTHIDKGHIHNHILFNNVSFTDGYAYNSNKKTYHQIRNISDKLCKEYGLSIIENQGKEKGKSYKEYQERKRGKSWKAQLQYSIDNAIKRANDWEDFLRLMRAMGYEIKEGKHISFRAKEQERFTRAKTIGEDYTEENIKKEIENRVCRKEKYPTKPKSRGTSPRNHSNLGRIIDLKNNPKAQEFRGYEIWAKQHNLKSMAKTLNLMAIHQINSRDELYDAIGKVNLELTNMATNIKNIESNIASTSLKIKNIETYNRLKPIYDAWQMSKDKESFYKAHTDEIILFEASKKALEDSISQDLLVSVPVLKKNLKEQTQLKEKAYQDYQKQKEKVSQLNFLKSNLETYMQWQEPEINQKREH